MTVLVNPFIELQKTGRSIWYDGLTRRLLTSAWLKNAVNEYAVTGAVFNPDVFEKVLSGGAEYDHEIAWLLRRPSASASSALDSILVEDAILASDALMDVYESGKGKDGYVSIDVSGHLSDAGAIIRKAKGLMAAINRPNVMLRIPASNAGMRAGETLASGGAAVYLTNIHTVERLKGALTALAKGLRKRPAAPAAGFPRLCVAGFSVNRIEATVDSLIDERAGKEPSEDRKARLLALRGRAGLSCARLAHEAYRGISGNGHEPLTLIWEGASQTDFMESDVKFIEGLSEKGTICLMPYSLISAFSIRGAPRLIPPLSRAGHANVLNEMASLKFGLRKIGAALENCGLKEAAGLHRDMLKAIESKRPSVSGRDLVQGFDLGVSAVVVAHTLNSLENMMFAKRLLAKDALLWTRSPDEALRISGLLGWLTLPYSMSGRLRAVASFAEELRQDGYKNVILLGMGGSSLAPLVLSSAFGQIKGFPRLIVLDSTDPQAVSKAGGIASKGKTVFIVSSKSGTTIEPMTLFERFYRLGYSAKGVNAGRDFVAITDPGTYLEGLAKKHGFRRVFTNTAEVGGRFSALSYFGLVPAAIAGIDVSRLQYYAQRMLELMHPARPFEENPALMLGACLGALCKEGRDKLTFFAPKALSMFPLWVEQLVAESTGKDGKGIVPVAGEPLLEAGRYAKDRLFVNIEMNRRSGAPRLMIAGLKKRGHPVLTFGLSDPYELGAEFMRWEAATAVAGAMLGINPFDQPDVELSKRLAMSRLDGASGAGGVAKPAGVKIQGNGFAVFFSEETFKPMKKIWAKGGSAALKAFFSLLKTGDYVALLPYLNPFDRPLHRSFTELRKTLAVVTGAATQFGWGPRYLHSTGQLHKGGPDNGVFVIFACAKGPEVAIPERGFDFLSLELSQAFGDMEALNAKGRRAALILLNDRSKTVFDNVLRAVEKAVRGRA